MLSTILDANGARKNEVANKKLSKKIKKDASHMSLTKHEVVMAESILDPASLNVTFDMIGGLDHTIEEIKVCTISGLNVCHSACYG